MDVAPQNRSIIEVLQGRGARRSLPPHGDGARVALAVEGGAMRGVVSCAALMALEDLGMTKMSLEQILRR